MNEFTVIFYQVFNDVSSYPTSTSLVWSDPGHCNGRFPDVCNLQSVYRSWLSWNARIFYLNLHLIFLTHPRRKLTYWISCPYWFSSFCRYTNTVVVFGKNSEVVVFAFNQLLNSEYMFKIQLNATDASSILLPWKM